MSAWPVLLATTNNRSMEILSQDIQKDQCHIGPHMYIVI